MKTMTLMMAAALVGGVVAAPMATARCDTAGQLCAEVSGTPIGIYDQFSHQWDSVQMIASGTHEALGGGIGELRQTQSVPDFCAVPTLGPCVTTTTSIPRTNVPDGACLWTATASTSGFILGSISETASLCAWSN